jgi:hypothetical protein
MGLTVYGDTFEKGKLLLKVRWDGGKAEGVLLFDGKQNLIGAYLLFGEDSVLSNPNFATFLHVLIA